MVVSVLVYMTLIETIMITKFNNLIKKIVSLVVKIISTIHKEKGELYIVVGCGDKNEFIKRVDHFIPEYTGKYNYVQTFNLKIVIRGGRLVVLDSESKGWMANYFKIYDLDFNNNQQDAWEWFELASSFNREGLKKNINEGRKIFNNFYMKYKSRYTRAYIFGTGPSLANATNLNWSNGLRIVSNTIVKDSRLWMHIKPNIIVAGDALYHFGHTEFAICFRRDLKLRLAESDIVFVYPAIFDVLVQREFYMFKDRLIPIPTGKKLKPIINLKKDYGLPQLGNVLNQLLLPLASTFSREIYFWGFDGRSADAKLFWQNSKDHFYEEHVESLKVAHPAFFKFQVPIEEPSKYVNRVHGDKLDNDLKFAEHKGFKFIMLHKSWTNTLNKRFSESADYNFLK